MTYEPIFNINLINMKRNLIYLLIAAVVCGLSLGVTSCSDDDDNGKSEEQKQQEAQEKASKFWDVVGQLVADDETEDYANKTFEPTYGIADANDPQTRIVYTNDMKTAAMRFANLVGTTKVNENTASYSYTDPDVGTLTYTKGDGTTAWATVAVDIKQIPHLSRIIYRKAGEGENGKFDGKAYYRFGDVVKRGVQVAIDDKKNPDYRMVDEYWICVRPAFGPEGKEDSHWVCVNTVVNNTVKYYKGSNDKEYWLPTSLKTNKEQMQNFAEMLWAIFNPTKWYSNASYYHTDGKLWGFDGVPIFHDFSAVNLKYHNIAFWENVQKGWKENRVVENALNSTYNALSELLTSKNMENGTEGVRLLHNGYSWWVTTSWNCQLWEAVYTNPKDQTNKESLNMHVETLNDKIEHNMKDITFDCRAMGKDLTNYVGFFNNDSKVRWTIRHAKGKELASDGKWEVDEPIKGVTEVYRYYNYFPDEATKKDPWGGDGPEITESTLSTDGTSIVDARAGDKFKLVCADGHIHDIDDNAKCNAKRVAMIAYVGKDSNCSNGLAIALEDAVSGNCDWINVSTKLNAWADTHKVKNGKWRVPTITDWYCITNGAPDEIEAASTSDLADKLKKAGGKVMYDAYWSSSQIDNHKIWYVQFDELLGNSVSFIKGQDDDDEMDDAEDCYLRGVLAF